MWRSLYQIRGNWPRSSLTMRFFEEINIDTSYFHVCKYTKKSQWSVQRSSLGQATNKRLTDHGVNNNIFLNLFKFPSGQRVGRGVSRASTKRCQICQKINVSFMIMTMPHDSMNNCSEYDVFIIQLLTDPHVVRCFQPITDS